MAVDNRTRMERPTSDSIDIIEDKLAKDLGNHDAYWAAIRELSGLVLDDPFNHLVYRNRGHHYLTIHEYELADADLELSLRMFDKHWKTWHYKAMLQYFAGNFDEAARYYDGAAQAVLPGATQRACVAFWQYVCLMRAGRKDSDKAKALLAAVRPETEGLHQGYKDQLLLLQDLKTVEELEAVIKTKEDTPQYVSAYRFGIAMYYLQKGDTAAARAELHKILHYKKGWYAVSYMASQADIGRI